MSPLRQKVPSRERKSISRHRDRRASFPGSASRQLGPRGFASALDFDRFLFTLSSHRPSFNTSVAIEAASDPGIQMDHSLDSSENENDSPRQVSISDNPPTGLEDALPSFAFRNRNTNRNEEEGRERENKAATSLPAGPQTGSAMKSAFRPLQLPSEISQADFIHLAIHFVFETYYNLQNFRDASDFGYDERSLATSFSNYTMAIWGDDAPAGANASHWLKNLQHFFAVLRTGPYMRGGTTSTLRDLLIRLAGVERVEASEYSDNHLDAEPAVDVELTAAYHGLGLTEVEDGREQDFTALAASHAFETLAGVRSEDLQGLGDSYDLDILATAFYTSYRVALWEGTADEDAVWEARMASLRRFFVALKARNYLR